MWGQDPKFLCYTLKKVCNSLGHGEYHVILTSIGCFVLGGVRIYLNCELEGTTFLAKSINQWPMPPACPSAKFLTLWWQHRPLALFPLSLSPDQEMQIWFLCPWDIWPLNLGWRIQPRPYLTLFFFGPWSQVPHVYQPSDSFLCKSLPCKWCPGQRTQRLNSSGHLAERLALCLGVL